MSLPLTQPCTDLALITGAEVQVGHQLRTEKGTWSSPVTRFDTPPAGTFVVGFYGEGTRIAHVGPAARIPLPPSAPFAVRLPQPEAA
ncbi:hypothetical protein [Spirillospora sp. CA-294931]|uniref:hypothetical protein n=1 Tax=Spirillospora sp. CA-294931 TaxID=3240042 RepID=UPI003D8F5918